jgi:hypothetical protein
MGPSGVPPGGFVVFGEARCVVVRGTSAGGDHGRNVRYVEPFGVPRASVGGGTSVSEETGRC